MIGSSALLSHLSRRTTSGQFIPEIDGLRFVSIGLVVLFHLIAYLAAHSTTMSQAPLDVWLLRIASTGHYGVQLFFIISGFVLALPFARHYMLAEPRPALRAYFLRRLTRLEPPYILAMLLSFVGLAAFAKGSLRQLLPHLATSLLYAHNLVYAVGSTINVVAWSLEVEVQFYVLAPLLALVFIVRGKPRRRFLILGLAVATILLQWHGVADDSRLSLSLINYLQFFFVGFFVADLYLTDWTEESRHRGLWDVIGIGACFCLAVVWIRVPRSYVLFPVLALLIFCAAFRGRLLRTALRNRWITTIGGMCYSIYLLHYPLISVIMRRTVRVSVHDGFVLQALIQMLIVLPILLIVCTGYFVAIERPCMQRNWPQRLIAELHSALRSPARSLDSRPVDS